MSQNIVRIFSPPVVHLGMSFVFLQHLQFLSMPWKSKTIKIMAPNFGCTKKIVVSTPLKNISQIGSSPPGRGEKENI